MNLPKPNPKDPVNYANWLNQHFEVDSPDNAAQDYLALAPVWCVYALTDEEMQDEQKADALMEERSELNDLIFDVEDKPWSGSRFAPITAWLEQRRPDFEAFSKLSFKRRCFFAIPDVVEHWMLETNSGEGTAIRSAVRHLATDGWGQIALGNARHMIENMLVVLRVAHQKQPYDVMGALGQHVDAMHAYRNLLAALHHSYAPGELADATYQMLVEADPVWSTLGCIFGNERLHAYVFLQHVGEWDGVKQTSVISRARCLQWSGKWNKLMYSRHEMDDVLPEDKQTEQDIEYQQKMNELYAITTGKYVNLADQGLSSFDETLQEFDQFYDALAVWADSPWFGGGVRARPHEALRDSFVSPVVNKFLGLGGKPIFSYLSQRERLERSVAMRNATRTVYALWSYKHRYGGFPENLAALEAVGAEATIIDPYVGRPFVYNREDGNFRLYSLGCDQKDDGGKHHASWGVPGLKDENFGDASRADGDFVFWPVQENPEQEQ